MTPEIINKYFPQLPAKATEQIAALQELYNTWNERVNVISRRDIGNLYQHHVLHSLAIAKAHPLPDGARIADIGTGGGFPGIPLAILYPNVAFTLVDSIGKKCTVAQEVASELGLANVEVVNARAESLRGAYDYIVSRAVTEIPKFVAQTRHLLGPGENNSILYLKGGDFTNELERCGWKSQVTPIAEYFEEAYFEEKYVVRLRRSEGE